MTYPSCRVNVTVLFLSPLDLCLVICTWLDFLSLVFICPWVTSRPVIVFQIVCTLTAESYSLLFFYSVFLLTSVSPGLKGLYYFLYYIFGFFESFGIRSTQISFGVDPCNISMTIFSFYISWRTFVRLFFYYGVSVPWLLCLLMI